jgi:hypothetical protein
MERSGTDHKDDGADIPERLVEILDHRSIKQSDIDADDYDGTSPISEHLQEQEREKRQRDEPPGQAS